MQYAYMDDCEEDQLECLQEEREPYGTHQPVAYHTVRRGTLVHKVAGSN